MVRFIDWLEYKRYLCLDLTRVADRIQSPTEPVSLIFIGNRIDNLPNPVQLYFLIERLNQVTFRFSSSDVAIVVGNRQHYITMQMQTSSTETKLTLSLCVAAYSGLRERLEERVLQCVEDGVWLCWLCEVLLDLLCIWLLCNEHPVCCLLE